jgi:hypothetical protein
MSLKKKKNLLLSPEYLVMILFTFFFFFPLLECNVSVRSVQHHNSEIRIPKHHDRAIFFFIVLSTSKNILRNRMVGPQRSRSLSSVFFQNLLCVWICFSFVIIYWLGFLAKGTALTTKYKLLKRKRDNSLAFLVMGVMVCFQREAKLKTKCVSEKQHKIRGRWKVIQFFFAFIF